MPAHAEASRAEAAAAVVVASVPAGRPRLCDCVIVTSLPPLAVAVAWISAAANSAGVLLTRSVASTATVVVTRYESGAKGGGAIGNGGDGKGSAGAGGSSGTTVTAGVVLKSTRARALRKRVQTATRTTTRRLL